MGNKQGTLKTSTGVVLIVAPLLGAGLKLISAGYTVFFLLYGPVVILAFGYVAQVFVAFQGFLSGSDLFGFSRVRATIAAWITSISVVATGLLFSDGTDAGYGSTLQKWLGSYGPNAQVVHDATDAWSDWLGIVAAGLWIVSYVWLLAEWIWARARRKAANSRSPVDPSQGSSSGE